MTALNRLLIKETILLSGPDQYDSGVRDGITAAFAAIRREADAHPHHVVLALALDVQKAFPSIDRAAMHANLLQAGSRLVGVAQL
eukprot:2416149-Prorocentrum_lima.AAC.1